MIMVNDAYQIVELVMAGEKGRFPRGALIALPISDERVHSRLILGYLHSHSHADCLGETMAERAGGNFNPRYLQRIRMTAQYACEVAKRSQVFLREEPLIRQDCIQPETPVALT